MLRPPSVCIADIESFALLIFLLTVSISDYMCSDKVSSFTESTPDVLMVTGRSNCFIFVDASIMPIEVDFFLNIMIGLIFAMGETCLKPLLIVESKESL